MRLGLYNFYKFLRQRVRWFDRDLRYPGEDSVYEKPEMDKFGCDPGLSKLWRAELFIAFLAPFQHFHFDARSSIPRHH